MKEGIEVAPLAQPGLLGRLRAMQPRSRQMLLFGGGAVFLIVVAVFGMNSDRLLGTGNSASNPTSASTGCQLKAFRYDQAANLVQGGAVIAYERNGGSSCIDELYAIYPDGRIVADDGSKKIEKQATQAEVEKLLTDIGSLGWFTDEMYTTSHTPCGQCFTYYLSVTADGKEKTVQAVDGGTDAPANYWQVVSQINGVIPHFSNQ